MERRETALEVIYQRVKAQRETLGLKGFERTPTKPIGEYALPCIFMAEDVDEPVTVNSRSPEGYPMRRKLEVVLEIAAERSYNIKQLYRDVRKVVFTGGVNVADDSFIREIRTEGPTGYGLPDVIGMRFVLALSYTDDGT